MLWSYSRAVPHHLAYLCYNDVNQVDLCNLLFNLTDLAVKELRAPFFVWHDPEEAKARWKETL